MPSDLSLIDGSTYFLSTENGDIEVKSGEGFFHADMRHLSTWQLLIDGEPMYVLASACVDYFSARVVGTLASAGPGTNPPITITRDRFIAGGVHEDLVVTNNSEKACKLTLELCFGSDFGDILQCRSQPKKDGKVWVEPEEQEVTLTYKRGDYRRGTTITFNEPCQIERDRAIFKLELGPRGEWSTCIDVAPVVDGETRRPRRRCGSFGQPEGERGPSLDEWLDASPTIETSNVTLARTYRQSLVDLASLRFEPFEGLSASLTAGGLPWFMALFTRQPYDRLPDSAVPTPVDESDARGTGPPPGNRERSLS